MRSNVKKRSRSTGTRLARTARKSRIVNAAATIRRIGDDWARHWNAGELDGVVTAYAEDAVYLPPHHEAVHGREAIREHLKAPLSHRVCGLAFDVREEKLPPYGASLRRVLAFVHASKCGVRREN